MNKKKSGTQAVSSKLTKTKVVLRSKELARHIPSTWPFNRERLFTMLERCRMVYVKPDTGSQGIGVMRVEKIEGGYRYQSGALVLKFPAFQAMYTSIQRRIGSRRYLIQKGIHVLRYNGRPFDFRIMIQKNPSRQWECTGTAARVAHPRKIVSNGSQGGTIFQAENLMNPIFGKEKTAGLLRHMNQLARLTAAQFSRAYPAMNELGLDIAVDRSLKPWILEVNTRPDPCPFTKLDNPASIRRIVRYARAYGRRYCLTCSKAKKAPGR